MMFDNIQIIGGGNVATHLFRAFSQADGKIGKVSLVNPRTLEGYNSAADVTVISVVDDAIREVAEKIAPAEGIVCHTSGSKPLDLLEGISASTGVFYPMQTFSKEVELNYSEIPFFIEGNTPVACERLMQLAKLISPNVSECDSERRRLLHIAAVFCCNFTNFMYTVGSDILADRGIDFSVMIPLVKQSALKIINGSNPADVQTGPAARDDRRTIASHIEYLDRNHPEYSDIYRQLSDLISKK